MSKVIVTVPSPYLIRSKRLFQHEEWVYGSKLHDVVLRHEPTPNRIDMSIWSCIDMAKEIGPTWWVRLDEDVVPQTPLDEMVRYAEECRVNLRCPVSATVILQRAGQVVVGKKPGPLANDKPTPVDWVGGSLVFTHRSVLDKLTPVGFYSDDRLGTPAKACYFTTRPNTTEDYDYSERVRELGFGIAADPRMLCVHMTDDYPIPSYRPPMRLGETMVLDTAGVGISPGVPVA